MTLYIAKFRANTKRSFRFSDIVANNIFYLDDHFNGDMATFRCPDTSLIFIFMLDDSGNFIFFHKERPKACWS